VPESLAWGWPLPRATKRTLRFLVTRARVRAPRHLTTPGENAWIDDALLRDVVTAGRADTARVLASRDSASVTRAIEAARGQAAADGVRGTPTFMVGRTGGTLKPLPLTSLDIGAFRAAFEDQLR
jgi:hypothetical protein